MRRRFSRFCNFAGFFRPSRPRTPFAAFWAKNAPPKGKNIIACRSPDVCCAFLTLYGDNIMLISTLCLLQKSLQWCILIASFQRSFAGMKNNYAKKERFFSSEETGSFSVRTFSANAENSECTEKTSSVICMEKDTSFAVSFSLAAVIAAVVVLIFAVRITGLVLISDVLLVLAAIIIIAVRISDPVIKINKKPCGFTASDPAEELIRI